MSVWMANIVHSGDELSVHVGGDCGADRFHAVPERKSSPIVL